MASKHPIRKRKKRLRLTNLSLSGILAFTGCEIPSTRSGGMAEWLIAAVLKTVDRKIRGFKSLSLRLVCLIIASRVP
jgi:hypothetical protein